jgi:hypothetical protein
MILVIASQGFPILPRQTRVYVLISDKRYPDKDRSDDATDPRPHARLGKDLGKTRRNAA